MARVKYRLKGSSTMWRWLDEATGHVYLSPEGAARSLQDPAIPLEDGTWVSPNGQAVYEQAAPQTTSTIHTGQGHKADGGKPRWVLLMRGCSRALRAVVRVLSFAVAPEPTGKGYVPHSWQEVPNAKERYEDALYRHLDAIQGGESQDPESKELHWAHVATNALFLCEFYEKERTDAQTAK